MWFQKPKRLHYYCGYTYKTANGFSLGRIDITCDKPIDGPARIREVETEILAYVQQESLDANSIVLLSWMLLP